MCLWLKLILVGLGRGLGGLNIGDEIGVGVGGEDTFFEETGKDFGYHVSYIRPRIPLDTSIKNFVFVYWVMGYPQWADHETNFKRTK